jgi:hypothetical protein
MKTGYLGRILVMFNETYIEFPPDTLNSNSWWEDEVKYQLDLTKQTKIDTYFFCDSITYWLGITWVMILLILPYPVCQQFLSLNS